MKLIGFLLLFTFSLRGNLFSAVTTETVLFIYNDDNQILLFYPRQEYKQSCNNKSDLRLPDISEGEQGAKKIIFTACHSSKLKLASTSPDVISTSPKSF